MDNAGSQSGLNGQGEGSDALSSAPAVLQTVQHVRLPPFWTKNPKTWFRQIEALFHARRIQSQMTKYCEVLPLIPPDLVDDIDDVLSTAQADRAYDTLKSAILSRTAISERSRIQQLLTSEELGDRRPSQLLHRMKQLLGDTADDHTPILRELFLNRLPHEVRMILAGNDDVSLDRLAELADRITDYASASLAPVRSAAVLDTPPTSDLQAAVARLTEEMSRMSSQMADLRSALNRRSRDRGQPRNRSASRRRTSSPTQPSQRTPGSPRYCWYHRRFRHRSTRCESPCDWQENPQAGR